MFVSVFLSVFLSLIVFLFSVVYISLSYFQDVSNLNSIFFFTLVVVIYIIITVVDVVVRSVSLFFKRQRDAMYKKEKKTYTDCIVGFYLIFIKMYKKKNENDIYKHFISRRTVVCFWLFYLFCSFFCLFIYFCLVDRLVYGWIV